MPGLRKSTALVVVGVSILLISGAFFYFLKPKSQNVFIFEPSLGVHYAGDDKIDLKKIKIKAVYFVPPDLGKSLSSSWDSSLEVALERLLKFYQFQLHGASAINYEIFPQPIVGREKHSFYDGEDTNFGNPNALLSVREELLERLFNKEGELYTEPFSTLSRDEYNVMAILYEGVGSSATIFQSEDIGEVGTNIVQLSSGGVPAFLVSRAFLESSVYEDYGVTILAHEFGHTLGLVDAYNQDTAAPISDDIMGAGRFKPLEATFISREDKQKLGLDF